MNDISSERGKQWQVYTNSNPTGYDNEAPWKSFGTSMNAISFGFVATAILISMFLIMAIFEHLFKPTSSQDINASLESGAFRKPGNPQPGSSSRSSSELSVVMPGHNYPTFIANPSPLPCQREPICWPSHQHQHQHPHNFE